MSDAVNHPAHYGGDSIYETIKVLEAWLTPEQFIGFCRGNAIKYQSRAGKKGDVEEDLRKASFYTQYEADFIARLRNGLVGEGRVRALLPPGGASATLVATGGVGGGGGGGHVV